MASSCSAVGDGEEERGDLIHFYNNIYIKQMRQFALRYSAVSPSAGVRFPSSLCVPSNENCIVGRMLLGYTAFKSVLLQECQRRCV